MDAIIHDFLDIASIFLKIFLGCELGISLAK